MTTTHCATCGEERVVEQPPCQDGHDECPEWVCVDCGAAFLHGGLGLDAPARRSAGHTAA